MTPPPLTQPPKQPAPEPAEVESLVTAVFPTAGENDVEKNAHMDAMGNTGDNTMGKAKDDAMDRAKGDAKEDTEDTAVREAVRKATDDAKQVAHESPFPEAADEVRSWRVVIASLAAHVCTCRAHSMPLPRRALLIPGCVPLLRGCASSPPACEAQSLCMHVLSTCMQAIQQVRMPETARLGITLRGLKKLTARLEADFAAGRLQRPASVAEADWPEVVKGLRTEHVNVAWVEEVTKGSRKRLIELLDYVAAEDVAPPELFFFFFFFISHACE